MDFIDTADCYPVPLTLEGRADRGDLGRWLRGKRDRFVLATKCFFPMGPGPDDRGGSRRHVLQAAEASLRRLQTDVIDLYQLHAFDTETPLEETVRALDDLVSSGKVRSVGCSNFRAFEVAKALGISERLNLARFTSAHLDTTSCTARSRPSAAVPDEGVGGMVFNPLAGGLLTGKHAPCAQPDPGSRFGERMDPPGRPIEALLAGGSADRCRFAQAYFDKRGKALASVAVAWVLEQHRDHRGHRGASRPDQLERTLAGSELTLDDDEERRVLDEVWYALPGSGRRRDRCGSNYAIRIRPGADPLS